MGLAFINRVNRLPCKKTKEMVPKVSHSLPKTMNFIFPFTKNNTTTLQFGQTKLPVLKEDEVLLKVRATALNRADLLQKIGRYPPPKGASSIIGLEVSGYPVNPETGSVNYKKPVCALLSGGGYAEYVAAKKNQVIDVASLKSVVSIDEAAAIPEAFLTAFQILHKIAKVKEAENVLVNAGASGVGTAAIQLIKHVFKAKSIVSCSSREKVDFCKKLGADLGFSYKESKQQNLENLINEATGGRGVDVLMDCVGAASFDDNLKLMGRDARWVLYGFLGGAALEKVSLAPILEKRIQIQGTTLRNRSDEYKDELVKEFSEMAMPLFATGQLRPVIDTVYYADLSRPEDEHVMNDAHEYMKSSLNKGKIVVCFGKPRGMGDIEKLDEYIA